MDYLWSALIVLGFILVFVGVLIMLLGIIRGSSRVEGGGVVVIGPIPIVFGTSIRVTKMLMILAIILMLMTIFLFIITRLTSLR